MRREEMQIGLRESLIQRGQRLPVMVPVDPGQQKHIRRDRIDDPGHSRDLRCVITDIFQQKPRTPARKPGIPCRHAQALCRGRQRQKRRDQAGK